MVQLGWWVLQFQLIRSIVSIVFILIDAIDSMDHIDRINCIDPSILNFSALQLKNNANEPTNSGMTFGAKKGNFSGLLTFTGICKDFTRSVWETDKIPLWVMTSNYPQDKSLTLQNHWGSNISLFKKVITIVIWHLGAGRIRSATVGYRGEKGRGIWLGNRW